MRYIQELREGENVNDIYFCKAKQILKTKAGKSYYSLTLQDKTGTIDAKVWDLTNAIAHFEAMDCPGAVFHHITDLSFVPHTDGMLSYTLDSVSIIRPLVDFSDVENIRIFYHHPADVSLSSVGR